MTDVSDVQFSKAENSILFTLPGIVTLFIFLLLGSTAIVPNIMNKDDDLQLYNSERSKFLYNTDLYEIVDGEIKEIYEDDNTSTINTKEQYDFYMLAIKLLKN